MENRPLEIHGLHLTPHSLQLEFSAPVSGSAIKSFHFEASVRSHDGLTSPLTLARPLMSEEMPNAVHFHFHEVKFHPGDHVHIELLVPASGPEHEHLMNWASKHNLTLSNYRIEKNITFKAPGQDFGAHEKGHEESSEVAPVAAPMALAAAAGVASAAAPAVVAATTALAPAAAPVAVAVAPTVAPTAPPAAVGTAPAAVPAAPPAPVAAPTVDPKEPSATLVESLQDSESGVIFELPDEVVSYLGSHPNSGVRFHNATANALLRDIPADGSTKVFYVKAPPGVRIRMVAYSGDTEIATSSEKANV